MIHMVQLITRGYRKSVELLFYDERNFVAIIGSKLLPATRDPRETRNVNVCIIMITCTVILYVVFHPHELFAFYDD